MTCKDCVHYEACQEMYDFLTSLEDIDMLDNKYAEQGCLLFKNKADFVEVKHAKWTWKELYGEVGYMLVCSECEDSEGACERFDYCPNCGARMDLKG